MATHLNAHKIKCLGRGVASLVCFFTTFSFYIHQQHLDYNLVLNFVSKPTYNFINNMDDLYDFLFTGNKKLKASGRWFFLYKQENLKCSCYLKKGHGFLFILKYVL